MGGSLSDAAHISKQIVILETCHLTFGLGSLVPVHGAVQNAVAYDAHKNGGFRLHVTFEERLVKFLYYCHQCLFKNGISYNKGCDLIARILTCFSSCTEVLKAVSSSLIMLGMTTRDKCPKFETTRRRRVSWEHMRGKLIVRFVDNLRGSPNRAIPKDLCQ